MSGLDLSRMTPSKGCLHWPGELEHGMWLTIDAPRIMAFARTDDGAVETTTFVATDFVDRNMDGIGAQVYAPVGTSVGELGEWWHRI